MYRTAIIFIFLALTLQSYSQYNSVKWYFGENAGLDFSEGSPKILYDGKTNSREGTASICDEYGNLLFYSDGKTVWNRQHRVMLNGKDLSGSLSSTNAAYAVPHPHNDNLFYLFTTDEAEKELVKGLSYSIIDISKDNGKGEVITKNVEINAPNAEKIITVPKPNQPAYWLITHDWGNSDFLVYTVDPYGVKLSHKIPSKILDDVDFENHSLGVGYIKYNNEQKKLAVAFYGKGFYLYDFNEKNGMLTNKVTVRDSLSYMTYGLEFSDSGNMIYTTVFDTLNKDSYLYQYQIDEIDEYDLRKSRYLLTLFSYSTGGIQKAPDGKIYVSTDIRNLSVIEEPDSAKNKCNFQKDVILFTKDQKVTWGFPRAVPQLQTNKYRIIHNSPICLGESLSIEANIIEGIDYRWRGPNGFEHNGRSINIENTVKSDFGTYICEFLLDNKTVFVDSIDFKMIDENLSIDDHNLELGDICRGYRLFRNVEIINDTEFPIEIHNIVLEDQKDEFEFNTSKFDFPIALEAGEKINNSLFFQSEIPGDYSNKIIVEYTNECDEGKKEFEISAKVLDANLTIDRSELDLGSICINDSVFKEIKVVNDSGNDILISEMFFVDGDNYSILDTLEEIRSNSLKFTGIKFKNNVPGIYKDTLRIIYDLTCEKGIRDFEFTTIVEPINIDIHIPDINIFQGADTCFYVTYETNCTIEDDFEMEFDLYFNSRMFYIEYFENAELINEFFDGDFIFNSIRIDDFQSEYKIDTLFQVCGNTMISDIMESIVDFRNINKTQYINIYVKPGSIYADELCFQEVMRIDVLSHNELIINTFNGTANVEITGEEKGKYKFNIINSLSRSVYSREWVNKGEFEKYFRLEDLPSGLYIGILQPPSGFSVRTKFMIIK